jgi:PAS domain S-box-containing protein
MDDSAPQLHVLFPGDSELAHRMRELDWTATPLGLPTQWPTPLKQAVALCLTSRFPIVMYWEPELAMLYNDPYIPLLGPTKHPRFLGRPGYEAWSDIWDSIDPLFQHVRATRHATWSEDFLLCFARHLPKEEVYVTFTVGPILLESGAVGGFFCPCSEVTEKVVAERRLRTLRDLGAQTQPATTDDEACSMAMDVLRRNRHDVSFAAIYLLDEAGGMARLAATMDAPVPGDAFPPSVALASGTPVWPLAAVAGTRHAAQVDLTRSDSALSGGPWPEPSNDAVVLPLMTVVSSSPPGLLVAGVNPRRVLDDRYRDFFTLVADRIGAAIADARAFAAERRRAEALAEIDRAKTRFFSHKEALEQEQSLRRSAEAAEAHTREELATELASMTRLHALCMRLLSDDAELPSLLEAVLEATLAAQNAEAGCVHLYEPTGRVLTMVAQRGLEPDVLADLRDARDPTTTWGRACSRRERIIVQDVLEAGTSAAPAEAFVAARYRGVESTPLFNRDGQPIGAMTAFFARPRCPLERELRFTDLYAQQAADLVGRRQTESALRLSEQRFRRYFDLGLIGMAITSPSKGIIEVNDELCRILGYERQELLQLTWPEITHPDDLAADVANFERVLTREIDGHSMDKRWIRKDGQVIDTTMSAQCVRLEDGSPDYFVGLVQDITERKLAEGRLRRSEAFLAEGQRLSHTGSWAWNASTGEVWWSQEQFRIFGVDPVTFTPSYSTNFALVHPDDRAEVNASFDRAVGSGRGFEREFRVVRTDGAIRHIQARAHPVFNDSRELTEYRGMILDVTDRKVAEEALADARFELARVMRLNTLGAFAATIAHEVNQPLAAIVTNGHASARWLAGEPPNLLEAHAAVARIIDDANRASDIIAGIRAFVQRGSLQPITFGLEDVAAEVVAMVQGPIRSQSVVVHTAIAAGLPKVVGDRIQLHQVVLNLVMNAVEAMTAVTDRPRTLRLRVEPYSPLELLFAVEDAGVGVRSEDSDRIFEPFFTTKETGIGMGLAISRSIIESHGGRLWATHNPAPGMTFQFVLPTADGRRAEDQ